MPSRPASANPGPQRDREQEILRAEQEALALEMQLGQDAERMLVQARNVNERIVSIEARVTTDVDAAKAVGTDLDGARLPDLDVIGHRERALVARGEAVAKRKQSNDALRRALETFHGQLARSTQTAEAATQRLEAYDVSVREANVRRGQAERAAAAAPPPASAAVPPQMRARAPGPAIPRTSAPGAARREQARVKMQAAIDFASDSNFFTGFSTNMSEGGLFVATVHTLLQGTQVDLSFSLPDGRKLAVKGVVRWTREVNDSTPDIFPGVGVQFLDLAPETAQAIKDFVVQREPLFYPD